MEHLTAVTPPTGEDLDRALARAVRQLIADAVEAEAAQTEAARAEAGQAEADQAETTAVGV